LRPQAHRKTSGGIIHGGRLLSSAQAIILEVHTLNKFVANENCCLAGSQISSKRSGPTSAKKYPLDVWPKRSTKKCAECDQSIASLQKGARTHFFCMCATKKVYAHSVSRSHTGMAHSMPSLVASSSSLQAARNVGKRCHQLYFSRLLQRKMTSSKENGCTRYFLTLES
jgi:hypothetical protein